ncbi:sister chromatid cohesion acetyltransferas-like protein Eco1 [Zopfia rhizophila CBS 207.26]|uniref:Sister chromatid cohesion acetyltransferas-like protein Eco1 n=1 Tax=Zopfia rhizophila CBS 207.26 TaxID=1314779 RepID=A0A6A6D6Q4_9PEZI|nr:sister chromatid cohesion acetyltransferas-like protein Eco1 [Zopfia rhizophila CBS 207.26]
MASTMSSLKLRKPIKTYSRHRKQSLYDDGPPTKRRRVGSNIETLKTKEIPDISSPLPDTSSSPTRDVSPIPTSSPKESLAVFSDALLQSTPPSSPVAERCAPPPQSRRSIFSFLRRKAESKPTVKKPLSERSHNVQPPTQPPPKKQRLVQMQLDLVSDVRKACTVCGMDYIPSNAEDAALHRKYHAMNVGGVDFSKAVVEKMKKNEVWAGRDGSFVAVIGRKDSLAFRNKASEVLNVVNTDLAAVRIPDEALWSQIYIPETRNAQAGEEKAQTARGGKIARSTSDRFKAYLYIRGQKCIGACLAERIQEAYTVLDKDDASEGTYRVPAEFQSSSISISDTTGVAILGISRIWTSNSHRNRGIATRLLESARSDFLYGMNIEKDLVAFSQPTESGSQLARKWFGRRASWHVYID